MLTNKTNNKQEIRQTGKTNKQTGKTNRVQEYKLHHSIMSLDAMIVLTWFLSVDNP